MKPAIYEAVFVGSKTLIQSILNTDLSTHAFVEGDDES
jgi:hypothetical protein